MSDTTETQIRHHGTPDGTRFTADEPEDTWFHRPRTRASRSGCFGGWGPRLG